MLNEQTLEFAQARLKLRSNLRFTMRQTAGDTWYIVEDEGTGKFFRIGVPQYTFLSMLNGRRTVNSSMMRTSTLLKKHALDENEVAGICKWAIESGLVETELSSSASRQAKRHDGEALQRTMSWVNPVMLKIPLFKPDGLITSIERYTGWLVSIGGAILWSLVVWYGFMQLALNWQSYISDQVQSFSYYDLFWIAITWTILKLAHELAHAIVCKRWGGNVQSSGVLLLLMIPLPYVDVSSSWRFESKWKRILTAAAGILAELFIAAIACCVWVSAEPGPWKYHAGNVIATATISTLLFNINPLMRFDGYYILSDWLDIPNLATHGKQYLSSFFKWVYFGTKIKPLQEIGWRSVAVKLYGFLAMGWFFMIAIGISIGASNILEGFGLILVMISLTLWFVVPAVRGAWYVFCGTKFEQPDRVWFGSAVAITVIVIAGFLYLCPSPTVVSAPMVVDYDQHKIIRAETEGFVRAIRVKNGDYVEEGDLLVQLASPELEAEYSGLIIEIKISKLQIDSYLKEEDIASLNLEREILEAAEERRAEIEQSLAELEIRAIRSGNVLAMDLDTKLDTYLSRGDEILSIGDQDKIHSIALARQEDIGWLKEREGDKVELFVWGRHKNEVISGTISRVNPRARDDLPHPAFSAGNGGPLAVVPREQVEAGDDQAVESDEWMLTNPCVPIEIALSQEDQRQLMAGQAGNMFIRGRHENMGAYLANQMIRFVRQNNFRTHGL